MRWPGLSDLGPGCPAQEVSREVNMAKSHAPIKAPQGTQHPAGTIKGNAGTHGDKNQGK